VYTLLVLIEFHNLYCQSKWIAMDCSNAKDTENVFYKLFCGCFSVSVVDYFTVAISDFSL